MSEIDEIKARLDIIDVIQAYTPLKKGGRNFKGLCPFHSEKTPSFVVFPDSQTWRCFGACGEGGDLFSFVMKAERLDFPETLQLLAERAGVDLKPRSPQSQSHEEAHERLTALLTQAAEFYMNLLFDDPTAEIARQYVVKRGLDEETVREFAIGYAPDGWQVTLDHFTALGYAPQDLLDAGLVIQNDQGRIYDRFRHRLMIPIHDVRGRVVGFGARALADDQNPKYLNSPQGELFDKSKLLYGLHLARRAIRETETVIVVEGYMDVIQAHQAGFKNIVAQMGTALTPTQVQALAKYAQRLILALDSDTAGIRATMRGLNVVHESLVGDGDDPQLSFDARGMMSMAGQLKLDTRILNLPEGKDPDEFIRAHADEWLAVVNRAIPLADYVIGVGTQGISPHSDIYERERVARDLLPLLTATENDLQRHENIQRLAMRLHIPERDLMQWARRETPTKRQPLGSPARNTQQGGRGNNPPHRAPMPPPAPPHLNPPPALRHDSRAIQLERYALSILLREPLWVFAAERKFRQLSLLAEPHLLAMQALEPFSTKDFTRAEHQSLFKLIQRASEQNAIEPQDFIQQNLSPAMQELVVQVLPEPLERFHDLIAPMHKRTLQSVVREMQRDETGNALETAEFLRCVLAMRLGRVERESVELRFLEEDARQYEEATWETLQGYYERIGGLAKAKTLIQKALHDLR